MKIWTFKRVKISIILLNLLSPEAVRKTLGDEIYVNAICILKPSETKFKCSQVLSNLITAKEIRIHLFDTDKTSLLRFHTTVAVRKVAVFVNYIYSFCIHYMWRSDQRISQWSLIFQLIVLLHFKGISYCLLGNMYGEGQHQPRITVKLIAQISYTARNTYESPLQILDSSNLHLYSSTYNVSDRPEQFVLNLFYAVVIWITKRSV